jgi:thiol-disulfide isomerase/thioredoxin
MIGGRDEILPHSSRSSQGESFMAKKQHVEGQRQQQKVLRPPAKQNQHKRGWNIRKQRARRNMWLLIGSICVLTALVISFFVYQANQQKEQAQANLPSHTQTAAHNTPGNTSTASTPTISTVQQQLTSLDASVLINGKDSPPAGTLKPVQNTPLLKDASGKPIFFYNGAEYCPYCAAQRWVVVVALSRFGSFGPLETTISGEANVPTFSFHNVTYTSQYIAAALKETGDNTPYPDTKALDTLTPEQQQWFNKYDQPPYMQSNGAIPFIDIANQYVSSGSYYQPDLLIGSTHQQIVEQLKNPNSTIAKGILGSANYLTAAICVATSNQPTSTCQNAPIPAMQQGLQKAALQPATNSPLALDRRRLPTT